MNIINKFCIIGLLFLIFFGSFLHFAYDLSKKNFIIGLFTPVNESVWEHLKMGFFSLLIFSLFEYPIIKSYVNNYFLAKLVGILVMEIFIVVVFYAYNIFTKKSILFLDISIYVVGAILCQIIYCKIIQSSKNFHTLNTLSIIILIIIAILFAVFTVKPPNLKIFIDFSKIKNNKK